MSKFGDEQRKKIKSFVAEPMTKYYEGLWELIIQVHERLERIESYLNPPMVTMVTGADEPTLDEIRQMLAAGANHKPIILRGNVEVSHMPAVTHGDQLLIIKNEDGTQTLEWVKRGES